MASGRGIFIEIIGDAKSYIRAAEQSIAATLKIGQSTKTLAARTITANESISASNTAMAGSYGQIAIDANLAAKTQVAASLRSTEAIQAQVVALRELSASATASAAVRERAAVLATGAEAQLARAQGLTVVGSRKMSGAVKEGERDLNKLVRGAAAGSGAFAELGRSLAFASSGFIAFAIGAGVIKESISSAIQLAKAQRQVDQQLKVSGKSWAQYGTQIDQTMLRLEHISGFTTPELLQGFGFIVRATGSVKESLNLLGTAADVARGRGITLAAASIALSKAAGGSLTALRRLGIVIPTNVKGFAALEFVARKFAGQAQAGTTVQDRFHAALVRTGETIGTALLPTFERLTSRLANWLSKMNESGELQKDVTKFTHDLGDAFHAVGSVIGAVDKVTGGFIRTLEILAGLKLASILTGWIGALDTLAAKWVAVGGAATAAGAAQTTALEAGGIAGARAGGISGATALEAGAGGAGVAAALRGRLQDRRLTRNLPLVFGQYTGAADKATASTSRATRGLSKLSSNIGLVGIAAAIAIPKLQQLGRAEAGFIGRHLGGTAKSIFDNVEGFVTAGVIGKNPLDTLFGGGSKDKPIPIFFDPQFIKKGQKFQPFQQGLPTAAGGTLPFGLFGGGGGLPRPSTMFGAAQPLKQFWKTFELTFKEQMSQAQAALTRSSRDDVAGAREVVARVKRLIDQGRLHGPALIQALGLEASALSTIWSAEDAIAQKRAAAAQKAKERAAEAFANLVDPLGVEVELLRAEAAGRSTLPALKKLLASARRALSQAKNLAQQQAALQQIVAIQQQIKDATTQASVQFVASAKLQLALAKDAALGRDNTKDLLRLKAAILKFIRTHKKNTQALIDAYNQLAAVNEQLGSQASSALGLFKQASTKALTEGLGLTAEQRRQLRARLSQLGPGQTVPGEGVGAGGMAIDPETGRPIGRNQRRRGRRVDTTGDGTDRKIVVHDNIDLNVYIDGKQVEANVTRHQQRRRNRNPSQRRGPNAGG